MSGLLSFLKAGNVTEVTEKESRGPGVARKDRQPGPLQIAVRVWHDGSVFPSAAAIDKFDLEYKDATIATEKIPAVAEVKDAAGVVTTKGRKESTKRTYSYPNGSGNGLDVVSSKQWSQFRVGSDADGAMIFVVPAPKTEPKVDLFASTVYDEGGKPKSSVADQGAATFGETVLLPMLEEVYGVKLDKDTKPYVDMVIFESLGEGEEAINVTEKYSQPILLLPKRISRGEDIGKLDYVRRENTRVYGFAPAELLEPTA